MIKIFGLIILQEKDIFGLKEVSNSKIPYQLNIDYTCPKHHTHLLCDVCTGEFSKCWLCEEELKKNEQETIHK